MIRSPQQRVAERKVDSDLPEDNIQSIEAPLEVEMPEVNPAFSSLVELFYLSGQAKSTGTGLVPLDWQELRAFRLENELSLTIWERETLKKMSEAYVNEYYAATEPSRASPYKVTKEPDEIDQVALAMRMRDTIRSLKKRK